MVNSELVNLLIQRGKELHDAPLERVEFVRDSQANKLVTDLDTYPHAFVLACIMDQQIKADRAWLIPHRISERIGGFGIDKLAGVSLEQYQDVFRSSSLHRFNDRMAGFFESAVHRIVDIYDGNAAMIWRGRPGSATLVKRFLEFDGVGPKIATMASNILARRFKVALQDHYSIDISPDVHVRRVFTRVGLTPPKPSMELVVYTAREVNPAYPGVIDYSVWDLGVNYCKPTNPKCDECFLTDLCPKLIC